LHESSAARHDILIIKRDNIGLVSKLWEYTPIIPANDIMIRLSHAKIIHLQGQKQAMMVKKL
jgi:hypothetical protein